MKETDFITRLNLKFNKNKLLKEFKELEFKSHFSSPNIKNNWLRATLTKQFNNFPNIKKLHNKFEGTKIFAFILKPYTDVHYHIDPMTLCAINIILSENYGPVKFKEYGEIYYKQALFNNNRMHSIPAFEEERLLLMFPYFNKSYEDVKNSLSDSLLLEN
mgnify:CR=1 FL=1